MITSIYGVLKLSRQQYLLGNSFSRLDLFLVKKRQLLSITFVHVVTNLSPIRSTEKKCVVSYVIPSCASQRFQNSSKEVK